MTGSSTTSITPGSRRSAGALNRGVLPEDYYAMAEQHAGGFGPDVLTLQGRRGGHGAGRPTTLLSPPKPRISAETPPDYYRRKQAAVVVRHVNGDDVVAVVEIASRGNKSKRAAVAQFVEKACSLFTAGVHLLVADLHPPGRLDPGGLHGAIWDEWAGEAYEAPPGEPLTVVSYEADIPIRAYIEPAAVGASLADAPLFLEPHGCVMVPMEATYQSAFDVMPRRWREVLQPGRSGFVSSAWHAEGRDRPRPQTIAETDHPRDISREDREATGPA